MPPRTSMEAEIGGAGEIVGDAAQHGMASCRASRGGRASMSRWPTRMASRAAQRLPQPGAFPAQDGAAAARQAPHRRRGMASAPGRAAWRRRRAGCASPLGAERRVKPRAAQRRVQGRGRAAGRAPGRTPCRAPGRAGTPAHTARVERMRRQPARRARPPEAGEERHGEGIGQPGEPASRYQIKQGADISPRRIAATVRRRRRRGRSAGLPHTSCRAGVRSGERAQAGGGLAATGAGPGGDARSIARSSNAGSASARVQAWPRPMIGARKRNRLPVPAPRSSRRGCGGQRGRQRAAPGARLRAAGSNGSRRASQSAAKRSVIGRGRRRMRAPASGQSGRRLSGLPRGFGHVAAQAGAEDHPAQRLGQVDVIARRADHAGFRRHQLAGRAAIGHRHRHAALQRLGDRHAIAFPMRRQREDIGLAPQRLQLRVRRPRRRSAPGWAMPSSSASAASDCAHAPDRARPNRRWSAASRDRTAAPGRAAARRALARDQRADRQDVAGRTAGTGAARRVVGARHHHARCARASTPKSAASRSRGRLAGHDDARAARGNRRLSMRAARRGRSR